MRMRRKPNLTRRLDACTHLIVPDPAALRGKWLQAYHYKEIYLELGCGKGRFIAETASMSPGSFFIALEKTSNVIITALELAVSRNIENLRFISSPAENIADFFAAGEISGIYINFCDPWPLRRHIKRRLTGRDFLRIYKELLCDNGEIHFKTDNRPLFDFSLNEFEKCGFSVYEVTRNLYEASPPGIMTEYEQRFYNQGMPILRCIARKEQNT